MEVWSRVKGVVLRHWHLKTMGLYLTGSLACHCDGCVPA
jgi:hypothetical protein